jgi:hypothetical protein
MYTLLLDKYQVQFLTLCTFFIKNYEKRNMINLRSETLRKWIH